MHTMNRPGFQICLFTLLFNIYINTQMHAIENILLQKYFNNFTNLIVFFINQTALITFKLMLLCYVFAEDRD